ncbi:MAG: glycosyltransferase [Anaerolineales bacterium]|nr:glycosyltransferase [Anaerolineales bacterium]
MALELSGYLQKSGHEVALYPWPEWLWGEPVRFGVAPGVSLLVYAPMAIPDRNRLVQNWKAVSGGKWIGAGKRSAGIDLWFLTGFQNALREFRPQILHCHYSKPGLPELLRLLNPKIPIVLTFQPPRTNFDWKMYDRIIVLRRAPKEDLRLPSGYPEAKIRIIDIPNMQSYSSHGERALRQSDSSFQNFGKENVRIYNELVSAPRTLAQ